MHPVSLSDLVAHQSVEPRVGRAVHLEARIVSRYIYSTYNIFLNLPCPSAYDEVVGRMSRQFALLGGHSLAGGKRREIGQILPGEDVDGSRKTPRYAITNIGYFADAYLSWFQLEDACAAGPAAKCRGPSEVVASWQTAEKACSGPGSELLPTVCSPGRLV